MNLRRISTVAMFAAAGALGAASCTSTADVESQLRDTKSSIEEQLGAQTSQGSSSGDGTSSSSSSNSGSSSGGGDAGSLEEFNNSNRADRNEGDAGALEDSSSSGSTTDHGDSDVGEGDAESIENSGGGNSGSSGQTTSDNVGPSISLVSKRCSGGKLLTQWSISDNSGVSKATVSRYNEFGAAITSGAQWMGPETGDGNQWTATSVGGQNLKETVKIVASDNEGNSSSSSTTAPAGC